ncbi:Ig-like domain repeat protein [Nocardioides dongkuii]|uniref:Ig-like domain repeat protein n=1 Tax=Nocardioides dongkuii TaxID=2760089 RepID=UPI0015F86658|nr:Ig-like domain repeat protein [Nocardioides dongkuii]
MPSTLTRSLGGGLAAVLLSATLTSVSLAPAHAAPADPEVAAGDGWTVTPAAGGYQVTVDLDAPLPIRSDAPTILVDGESIGLATESADGLSLSVFTADPAVADAAQVTPGWASQSDTAGARTTDAVEVPPATAAKALDADPSSIGSYDWTESIYKFGEQSIPLAAIGGIDGELEGKLYLPTTGGARPTVVLLHGRHGSCYGTGTANPLRWPCTTTPEDTSRKSIPSYLGYDGTARALASNGYAVVSISANAINANDNQLAADQGAQARGQLLLDTLTLLRDAGKGDPVSYHDAWEDRDVSLDQAFVEGAEALAERAEGFPNGVEPLDPVRAADLVGRFDLSTIGMMGHSRGGEGVTSAAVLNQALDSPWAIESILPLAPVDFGRMTVPDVPMNVMLPYCDGDVSNQQGQHMLDDSRYAFDDDVLRSGVWAMGANHNFYNTVWTPGQYAYSVSDDWSGSAARRTEPICGTDPTVAETSIRMTPQEQYDQGTAYMAGWFRATLGGERQFLPMFDGTGAVPAVLGDEDVRSMATAPASARSTVTSFESTTSLVRTFGTATATVCASMNARTTAQTLPACTANQASATVPHWTPATNGGNVPATPVTRMTWTSGTGELRVGVPAGRRDARGFERLSVKMAADETVASGTDLTLTVVDGKGATWRSPVSALNPLALVRLPTSTNPNATSTLRKIVLQQVNVPTAALTEAGLTVGDLREVRFTAAQGLDATAAGGAYLSDLAFESSAVGTPRQRTWPTIDVYAPNTVEGDAPGTVDLAVYLDEPATSTVVGYASLLGSSSSRAGATMERVTFAPGQTCQVVTAAVQGDDAASTTNGTTVKASVINTSGAVMGKRAIVNMTVSEDDGLLPSGTPPTTPAALPAYGTPGPACAELEGVLAGGTVEGPTHAAPGSAFTLTAAGFRSGESVTFTATGMEPVTVVADGTGLATATLTVPADVARGDVAVTAVGAGTGRTATGAFSTKAPTSVTLAMSEPSGVFGTPGTVDVEVSGATGGEVELTVGSTTATVPVDETGSATYQLPALLPAGRHTVRATYLGTADADRSTSTMTYRVTKKATRTKVKAARSVAGGGKLAVTVRIRDLVPGAAPLGEVKLRIVGGGGTYDVQKLRRLTAGRTGTVTFTLTAPRRLEKLRLTARYIATGSYAGSTSPVRTVRVR